MNITNMSVQQLNDLASRCLLRAKELQEKKPTYQLAIDAGILDLSYRTVRYGLVRSYRGEKILTMENGDRWKCVGHPPTGSPSFVEKQGFIEFFLIEEQGVK